MTLYYFDYDDGLNHFDRGREGIEFANVEEAKEAGVSSLAAISAETFAYEPRVIRFIIRTSERYVCEIEVGITVRDLEV